jgi:predicted transcriptional regulator of viral defense system
MIFEEFRKEFIDQICFTSNQVYAWHPAFDKNNLTRWVKKGYLIKLKNDSYTFSELRDTNNIQLYIANRMYRPSYVSLHSAMAFHGFIPESIVQTTSVSTMKTKRFENSLGSFSYKKLKTQLFFGYTPLQFSKDKIIFMALPEKSILDLLYLYPFYNTKNELLNLRLDKEMLNEVMNIDRFQEFMYKFENKNLEKRANLFFKCFLI